MTGNIDRVPAKMMLLGLQNSINMGRLRAPLPPFTIARLPGKKKKEKKSEVYLLYQCKSTNSDADARLAGGASHTLHVRRNKDLGAEFTCFTSTKVQILTPQLRVDHLDSAVSVYFQVGEQSHALLVQKYKY